MTYQIYYTDDFGQEHFYGLAHEDVVDEVVEQVYDRKGAAHVWTSIVEGEE
jgi:hypothetical protein